MPWNMSLAAFCWNYCGHAVHAENKCFSPFAHRVMFQRVEKLCAVPTAGLQEEKHPDYVSVTWWMSCPNQHRMQPVVPLYILTMDSLCFLLAWICLDFESVFRKVVILKLSPFFLCAIIHQMWIALCVTHSLSVKSFANVLWPKVTRFILRFTVLFFFN